MPLSADERRALLARWVRDVVGEPTATVKRRPGGGSHQAWDVLIDGEPRWFLRADAAEPDPAKHYTLRREAHVYAAVHAIGLPSPAVLGPFCTYSVVSISRPIRVIVSTFREWMMAVCLKPCSYFFARAMAVSTSRVRT